MPNTHVSAHQRLLQFQNSGFFVKNKQLWCKFCNVQINFSKKSVVEKHRDSALHSQRKAAVQKVEVLPVVLQKQKTEEDKWTEMVSCFTAAGVPLKVFRNKEVREWIGKHVKQGQTLPSETSLRKLLLQEGLQDLQTTTEMCRDKTVIVTADESMDLKNRKLLNILIGVAEPNCPSRLVASKFVKKCDAVTVSNSILNALQTVSVSPYQLVCLKSDNARYMLSAGKTLKGLASRMIHSTCWSHVLHLVSEEIRGKLKKADNYISSLKSVLVKAPSRREELLDSFEEHGYSRTLPPIPVITRWCTWLEAGDFHHNHLNAEINWINETTDNSAIMHKLKKMCGKEDLKQELFKIHKVCAGISSSIKTLEKRDLPASDVWLHLQTVLDLTNEALGKESEKLNAYLEGRHPAIEFWNEVQYFDPRKASQFLDGDGREQLPDSLAALTENDIGIHEILKYKTIRESFQYDSGFCPFQFWSTFSREMPQLSKLALIALSIPASSSEVERSFSVVKRILTAQRNSYTEENLGIHLRMSFNRSKSTVLNLPENEFLLENESDVEGESEMQVD